MGNQIRCGDCNRVTTGMVFFPDEGFYRCPACIQRVVKRYRAALKRISDYDWHSEPGICPYGCDTPDIAERALEYSENPGCDRCGVNDREPGTTLCAECLKEEGREEGEPR